MPRSRSTTCSARRPAMAARRIAANAPPDAARPVYRGSLRRQRAAGLPWRFEPERPSVKLRAGERRRVSTRSSTERGRDRGIASSTSCPSMAGAYFNKIQCFCFTEQTLGRARSSNCRSCSSSIRRSTKNRTSKGRRHDHALLYFLPGRGDSRSPHRPQPSRTRVRRAAVICRQPDGDWQMERSGRSRQEPRLPPRRSEPLAVIGAIGAS